MSGVKGRASEESIQIFTTYTETERQKDTLFIKEKIKSEKMGHAGCGPEALTSPKPRQSYNFDLSLSVITRMTPSFVIGCMSEAARVRVSPFDPVGRGAGHNWTFCTEARIRRNTEAHRKRLTSTRDKDGVDKAGVGEIVVADDVMDPDVHKCQAGVSDEAMLCHPGSTALTEMAAADSVISLGRQREHPGNGFNKPSTGLKFRAFGKTRTT
ncbi:hypothetical protein RRG08_057399 [Elysia crispata]|uniref:Uncharacterized protein n=1 Tax=Elysia crispata TaxID=231223 RepID=A0AAE1B2Z2_9GAST|nr:hypothetical protein RRG08_057399 [Elysia crispata]